MVSVLFPKESKVSEVKATGRRAKQPAPHISYHQEREFLESIQTANRIQ